MIHDVYNDVTPHGIEPAPPSVIATEANTPDRDTDPTDALDVFSAAGEIPESLYALLRNIM